MNTPSAEKRVTKARIELLISFPFLGTLVLGLKTKKFSQQETVLDHFGVPFTTMATDGEHLFYKEDFVDSIPYQENDKLLVGVIAHEVFHCVYQHVLQWRHRTDRNKEIWSMACEFMVNSSVMSLCVDSNGNSLFDLPFKDEIYYHTKYDNVEDWHTEKIYYDLLQNGNPMPNAGDGECEGDGPNFVICQQGVGDNKPLNDHEMQLASDQMKIKIAQAMHAAKMIGKLPAQLEKVLSGMMESKVPWQQVLANFVKGFSKDDYTWKKPNKRHLSRDLVLPSLHTQKLRIGIAFDTSGSMFDADELEEAWSEFLSICNEFSSYEINLFGCDTELASHKVINKWDDDTMPEEILKGGGGSNMTPVFDAVQKDNIDIEALIFFSDLYIDFPDYTPNYPVLWFTRSSSVEVPFGEVHLM